MRKPIICGNWKMHKNRDEALQFIFAVNQSLPSKELVDIVICPPAIILRDLVKRQGDEMRVGAQTMHYAESGAYTGEISADMLKSTGVEYVIIGHSERRTFFNETNDSVNLKVKAALKYELKPIICVGETLAERQSHRAYDVLKEQISKAFRDIKPRDVAKLIIAYEPLWAIGTGETASSSRAEKAIAFIRSIIAELFTEEISQDIRIMYGGSVNADNALELMSQPDIDGLLVGGASLYPDSFIEICKAGLTKKEGA